MLKGIRIISAFIVVLLITALAHPASAQALTGSQILAKCAAAYDALTSYSCHVDSSTTGGGMGGPMSATADIEFLRPGQLMAAGTSMFKTPYEFVTNGTAASVTANGATNPAKDAEYGLASVTGIGGTAPTIVSALLLHTQWGTPFIPSQTISAVTNATVNGRPCYEVDVATPLKRAFWIDTQTFLLVQVATKMTMGNFGTYHELLTITNSQINPPIEPLIFTIH